MESGRRSLVTPPARQGSNSLTSLGITALRRIEGFRPGGQIREFSSGLPQGGDAVIQFHQVILEELEHVVTG